MKVHSGNPDDWTSAPARKKHAKKMWLTMSSQTFRAMLLRSAQWTAKTIRKKTKKRNSTNSIGGGQDAGVNG
jgi:hypothetical protein